MSKELDHIMERAGSYASLPPEQLSAFLNRIGDEINALGAELISVCQEETALSPARLTGERARTVNQLRLFAELVREGSWIDARIDVALPDRTPLPRPDIRRMLVQLGPVAVFAASNFPLAFSVAGGDTASALAAGCPVVIKPHPGHPRTSRLVAEAIDRAISECSVSTGVFSMLSDTSTQAGLELVTHKEICAVGFTGSLGAGRALYEAAASRPHPIPVFAEMGSLNPLFVLPEALEKRADRIAKDLAASVTLGVGQFCTKPGLVCGLGGKTFNEFRRLFAQELSSYPGGKMLTESIEQRFQKSVGEVARFLEMKGPVALVNAKFQEFSAEARLREELFGPATVLIECTDMEELTQLAQDLTGQLTATIHAEPEDNAASRALSSILTKKAGRIIWNGYPTGVEVCPAMQHGGPFPATTDSRFTSVGTAAIFRFARPICLQNAPPDLLPEPLLNRNTRGIWRTINGELTKENLPDEPGPGEC
ncbi:MAG: aldehyde dehydrogenase (NADP(+)) [Verrucomicrobia bacterium]|nr:aldehyde dehydrogenase (NADP(+)) [Verrucomicrobiota bacterium]